MSWLFQSNDPEKQALLELIEAAPEHPFAAGDQEKFKLQVAVIAKPVNVDKQKLAALLASQVFSGNKPGARKVVGLVAKERLGAGPRILGKVLLFPIFLAWKIVEVPRQWGKRLLDAF